MGSILLHSPPSVSIESQFSISAEAQYCSGQATPTSKLYPQATSAIERHASHLSGVHLTYRRRIPYLGGMHLT